jgi:hypothetical protein
MALLMNAQRRPYILKFQNTVFGFRPLTTLSALVPRSVLGFIYTILCFYIGFIASAAHLSEGELNLSFSHH